MTESEFDMARRQMDREHDAWLRERVDPGEDPQSHCDHHVHSTAEDGLRYCDRCGMSLAPGDLV